MTLEEQLQDAYQRAAALAPVPPGAYDRFLRRRARRGRVRRVTGSSELPDSSKKTSHGCLSAAPF